MRKILSDGLIEKTSYNLGEKLMKYFYIIFSIRSDLINIHLRKVLTHIILLIGVVRILNPEEL